MCKKLTSILLTFVMLFSVASFTAQALYIYPENYSCKISNRSDDNFKFFVSKPIAVEPYTEYVVSVWSKGGGAPSVRILNSTTWGGVMQLNPAAGVMWQYRSATFNSGDVESVLFALTNNPYGVDGTMYVDDVYLAKASDPGTNLIPDPGFELDTYWDFKEDDTIFRKESYDNIPGGDSYSITSISVNNPKTEYNLGDEFVEPSVTATYSDGSKGVIEGVAFTGYDMNTPGKQTVTVICDGHVTTYDITVNINEEDYRGVKSQFPWGSFGAWTGGGTTEVPVKMEFVDGEAEGGVGKALVITGGNTGSGAYAYGQFMMPADYDLTDVDVISFRYKSTAGVNVSFVRYYLVAEDYSLDPSEVDIVKELLGNQYSTTYDENGKNISGKSWNRETASKSVFLPSTNGEWSTIDFTITAFGNYEFLRHMCTKAVGFNLTPAYVLRIEGCTLGDYTVTGQSFTLDSVTGFWAKSVVQPDVVYGDVSGDGVINNTDLKNYKNYIELGQTLPISLGADLNNDGRINNTDFSKLKEYIEFGIQF